MLQIKPSALLLSRTATQAQFFVNGMLFATWGVHIPTVKAAFALDESALSLLMLAAGIGALISLSRVGHWVAHHGTRSVVLAGGLFVALPLGALLWLPNYAALLAALFVFGLANGSFDVAMNAEAVAVEHAYQRPIMSSLHGFFSLGGLTGALLGSLAAHASIAPWVHIGSVAGTGFAVVLLTSFYMLPTPVPSDTPSHSAAWCLPDKALLLLGMLAALGLIGESAMYDWSTLYMVKVLNSSTPFAALAYGAFSGAMALGRFGGDHLRARAGASQTLFLSAWLAAFALIATLLLGNPWAALPGFALVGFGFSNMIPVLFSAAARVPGVSAASGIATVSSLGYLAFMLGPPMIGAIAHQWGLAIALVTVALFAALAGLLAHRAMRMVHIT
jgi:predicted MFS family arabinose efflux permease